MPGRAGNASSPCVLSGPWAGALSRSLWGACVPYSSIPTSFCSLLCSSVPGGPPPCQPANLNSSFKTNLSYLTFSMNPSDHPDRELISPSCGDCKVARSSCSWSCPSHLWALPSREKPTCRPFLSGQLQLKIGMQEGWFF